MGRDLLNIGLGVAKGSANPREKFESLVKSYEPMRGSNVIHAGGGVVPTRRPMSSMVWNGIMFIGDAGFTVNPIHGGGIGSSMLAGRIAGEVSSHAITKGDTSLSGLWGLNPRYMKGYGAKQASLDVFRIFLIQGATNELIDYGMEHQLIKQEDLLRAMLGSELQLNITEKASRFFNGIGKIGFLLKLKKAVDLMKETKRMYANYPDDPSGFKAWDEADESLHRTAHNELARIRY